MVDTVYVVVQHIDVWPWASILIEELNAMGYGMPKQRKLFIWDKVPLVKQQGVVYLVLPSTDPTTWYALP